MKGIIINGRIFEFPITGVGRFCYEVMLALDMFVRPEEFILGVPYDATNVPKLKNIDVRVIGKRKGIYWEQIELPLYAKRNNLRCLSMSNSVPLFKADYVLIHDISLKKNLFNIGNIDDLLRVWWPLLQYRIAIKKSRVLFTVSQFQKKEIRRTYKTNRDVVVVYEGWQHMNRITADEKVIEKYGLKDREYMYAVSSRTKNKNFKWIMKVAENNPRIQFVVSGLVETKYFSDDIDLNSPNNIVLTGYVSDEEMKGLMKHARAFLYPSIYEGFGIPPLEAISVGTQAIVGRSSCLPEIYGDSAYYVDPYDYSVDLDKLLEVAKSECGEILKKYNWDITAKIILSEINRQTI